jgi:hypothetical protein
VSESPSREIEKSLQMRMHVSERMPRIEDRVGGKIVTLEGANGRRALSAHPVPCYQTSRVVLARVRQGLPATVAASMDVLRNSSPVRTAIIHQFITKGGELVKGS